MSGASVSNVILPVADLARSLRFYRDRLGLTVRWTGDAFAFLDGGGVTVALNERDGLDPQRRSDVEVVLEVSDVAATHRAWVERGVAFEIEPRAVTGDGTRELHAAHFYDPDGNLLSLTGWVTPQGTESSSSTSR